MKTIPLAQGKVALVDDEDYEMLSAWHWGVGTNGYVVRFTGNSRVRRSIVYMLPDPDGQVDHINHDRLDNRRANLRTCEQHENARNVVGSGGTSAYQGVDLLPSGRWRASVKHNRKRHHVGCFATEEEAARARDEAALRLHGQYARLNFPAEPCPVCGSPLPCVTCQIELRCAS